MPRWWTPKRLYEPLIALALLFSAAALAQDAGYDLTGSVAASGSTIDGGAYSMSGALGQADTGTLSGGDYSLGGGFFGGGVISGGARDSTYLPMLRRWSHAPTLAVGRGPE